MEGKEVRFGIPGSVLFAVSTTGTSTGAVNAAHDSFSPLGGGAGNATAYLFREFARHDTLEVDLVTSSTGAFGPIYQVDRVGKLNPPLVILGVTYDVLIRLRVADAVSIWLGEADTLAQRWLDSLIGTNPEGVFPYGFDVWPDDAGIW